MKKLLEKGIALWNRHREVLSYLFFGGVTTVVNFVVYTLLAHMGYSTEISNAIAWAVSVLVAYITNRLWVFGRGNRGLAMLKEFLSFVACRLATGVLDQTIMVYGVDVLGPKLVGADKLKLWGSFVKILSNILVIIANYVFSKLLIFRKKKQS